MFQPLRQHLTGLATLAALLSAGTALAQSVPAASVRIFEEPPPMELLRSIMVPESRSGLTRRIVLGAPDQPAPLTSSVATPERSVEAAPNPPAPRRTRPQGNASSAMVAAAGLVSPLPAPVPEVARPAPATPGSIGFRINFALNSDAVPHSAFPFIDRIAELLREQAQVKLQVEGHTDALGSDTYNLELSQRRAVAVANYLVDRQGIEATRLVVLGMGESAPLVENGYDPRNRRVQFARVD
jgi:outer membrane protein OmpA-like peptidoglycan-associated protein